MLKGILLGGAKSFLKNALGEIAMLGTNISDLGKTPYEYSPDAYGTVLRYSTQVILPFGAIILTFVMVYDLYQIVLEGNNFHNVDSSLFIRWMIKTTLALIILTNLWDFIGAIFHLVAEIIPMDEVTGGISLGDIDGIANSITEIWVNDRTIGDGEAIALLVQTLVLWLICMATNLLIQVLIVSRFFKIYLILSLAPIPMATFGNRELSELGKNYIKKIFALAFQAILIILVWVIYLKLINGLSFEERSWEEYIMKIMVSSIVCIVSMKSTSAIADSIFTAR